MKQTKNEIKGKEKWRDLSITKICDNCGEEYHPRKSGYENISRFCSQKCVREARRKKRFRPFS